VVLVEADSKTLVEAVNKAVRDWDAKLTTTHFLIISLIHSCEIKAQMREVTGEFLDIIPDTSVHLVSIEAGGDGAHG
ncbi:hypothetical protein BKA82DRAFT_128307, partial [Pisolithus tinctorius]